MPDSEWYYAEQDREMGPVSEEELRARLAAGGIRPQDLVWTDGMPDWQPAREVARLRRSAEETRVGPPPMTPARRPAAEEGEDRRTAAAPWLSQLARRLPLPWRLLIRAAGWLALTSGLLVALAAHGCDSLSARYAARVESMAQVARPSFEDRWKQKLAPIEARIAELEQKSPRDPADDAELANLEEDRDRLMAQRDKSRTELERTTWFELDTAARDARADHAGWQFWLSGFFFLGSLILLAGLVILGIGGAGPERWLALVMLAIVVYALLADPSRPAAP